MALVMGKVVIQRAAKSVNGGRSYANVSTVCVFLFETVTTNVLSIHI